MKTAFLLILLCSLTLSMAIGALDKFVATADAKDNCAAYSRKLNSNSSTIIWVPGTYTSIQEAINEASPGDMVYVGAGVYYEDIVVNKSLFLIGENATTTVLNGKGESLLILGVVTSDVTVCNFTVKKTRVDQPAYGISIKDSQNVTLMNVTVAESYTGLVLANSSNCEIVNNAFMNSYAYGVDLRDNSVNNTVVRNWVVANPTGIRIWDTTCENNRFHHNNFINNTNQVDIKYAGPTIWDDGNEGNYWNDYTGLDDGSDGRVAGDGVGDTLLPHQNVDYYPLMSQVPLPPIPPIAGFSIPSDPLIVNEPIAFDPSESYDPDGTIVSYFWDFGDGTTKLSPNKEDANIVAHSYANAGSYTVNLTVTDDDHLHGSIAKTLTVQKMNSSIALTVVPSAVTVGNNVTIGGYITPKKVGVNVTIYYMFWWPYGWKELITVKTDFYGNYSYVWTITQAKYTFLKANWTGNNEALGAESCPKSIDVKKTLSSITVNVEPQNVTVGSNVTAYGTISPMRENVNVSVQISRIDDPSIVLNATIKTDTDGSYVYVWKTSQAGMWEIKVSWDGDQNTTPAESNTETVNVEALPPPALQNLLPYVVAAILIIIALLASVYFLKRKQ